MGTHIIKRILDIGDSLVLAPERYDPRRTIDIEAKRRLSDLADVITESFSAKAFSSGTKVLILDTTHAYEGFVIFKHELSAHNQIGSAKRKLQPGDVIVSRLRPYLRQVAYVDDSLFRLSPEGNEVVASSEFFVIRGRNGFDAVCLIPYLLSETVQSVLEAGQEGGHHPRFGKELLLSLPVPNFVLDQSVKTGRKIRLLSKSVRESFGACKELILSTDTEINAESYSLV